MYKAATIYYDLTIDQYPESKWAEVALVELIAIYNTYAENSVEERQAERYQKAIDTYENFFSYFQVANYVQRPKLNAIKLK